MLSTGFKEKKKKKLNMEKIYYISNCCLRITNRSIQSQCRHQQFIACCHISNFATFSHERKMSPITSWKRASLQILPTRSFSDEKNTTNEKQPTLPDLMQLPTSFYLTVGSMWDLFKVWLVKKFVLSKIDKEFDAKEFVEGATKAIEVVSHRLAAQEYNALEELITPEALDILRTNINRMTEKQRREIPISVNDIRKSYIADITVSEREGNPPRVTVQIMIIALASNIVSEPIDGIEPNGPKHQLRTRKRCCVYRFVSPDFASSERQWTINLLNHVDSRDFISKIKF